MMKKVWSINYEWNYFIENVKSFLHSQIISRKLEAAFIKETKWKKSSQSIINDLKNSDHTERSIFLIFTTC